MDNEAALNSAGSKSSHTLLSAATMFSCCFVQSRSPDFPGNTHDFRLSSGYTRETLTLMVCWTFTM